MLEKLCLPKDFIKDNSIVEKKYFNPKMGALGGAFMASIVFYINSEYGINASSFAALKQGAYTFCVGSFIVGMCENTAIRYENSKASKVMGVLVPSITTTGLTYLVHSLKGTPDPIESTLPTAIGGPLVFSYIASRTRNDLDSLVEKYKKLKII